MPARTCITAAHDDQPALDEASQCRVWIAVSESTLAELIDARDTPNIRARRAEALNSHAFNTARLREIEEQAMPTNVVSLPRRRSTRTQRQTAMVNLALDLKQDANAMRGPEGGVLFTEAQILEAMAERDFAAVTEAVRGWGIEMRQSGRVEA